MTLEPPASPPSTARRDADTRSREPWRLLLALVVGFSLPVLACFGLMLASALALQIVFAGSRPPGLDVSPGGLGRGPAVGIIRVEGVIVSGEGSPLSGLSLAASRDIAAQVKRAQDDPDVKAVVLAVNSPGGGVVASDEILHALQDLDKPIVVVMGDVAASGGYYISMAGDWIIANPDTLTGSIGVISEFPNAEGLLEKVGVDFVVVTSGPRKDFGSPYREMTEAERAYWQTIVDEAYEGFVEVVADGRQMTAEEARAVADGGIYTGRQALDLGLIDQLGYEADAIAKAAELGGIAGEPRLIEFESQPTLLELLTQAAAQRSLIPSLAEIMSLVGHPRLSARWIGP